MIEKALKFYDQLLRDLEHCQSLYQQEKEIIESCFKISLDYWNGIKSWLKDFEFSDIRSEIAFFRHVKPLFTGEIEYYTHCYKAVLFLPSSTRSEQVLYWERELAKIEQFYETQSDFIKYFKNGNGDNDYLYFIRANNDGSNLDSVKAYELDVEVCTSHDWLITALFAYEKYSHFINEKLKNLGK